MTQKTQFFPQQGEHATLAFLETDGAYLFQVAQKSNPDVLVKGDFQKAVLKFLDGWLTQNGSESIQGKPVHVELWVRAGDQSLQDPKLVIVMRSPEGAFLVAPQTFDPRDWGKSKPLVLVNTDYPRILGFLPGKVTVALKEPLATKENVQAFEAAMQRAGVTGIKYGQMGAFETYNVQVLISPGKEAGIVAYFAKDRFLKKWVASAEQSPAYSYNGRQLQLTQFTATLAQG